MDTYLKLNFSKDTNIGLLSTISQELTFDGIDIPVNVGTDIAKLLNSCKDVGLKAALLITDDDLPDATATITNLIYNTEFNLDDLAIGMVEKPDLDYTWKDKPEKLGKLFSQCTKIIRKKLKTVTIITPSISNLGSVNITYLKRMFSVLDPTDAFTIGVHRYPAYINDWDAAHRDFGQRNSEVEALKTVIGPKKFWITAGCSQNYMQKKAIHISEQEQTDYCKKEIKYWKDKFVPAMTWYHLDDGPEDINEDGFGIRKYDNTPKNLWYRFPQIITMGHM